MKKIVFIICMLFAVRTVFADTGISVFTLSQAIDYALQNSPLIRQAKSDMDIGDYRVRTAKAGRLPKLDLISGVTHSRYQSPVTPISGSPLEGSGFPEFDDTIYDFGLSFTLPLYRGGILERTIIIEKIRRSVAKDMYDMSRQELIYNITSVFDKILQLEKLLLASNASVRQLEAHKQNVELFLQAGTVPRVELLKTNTELAHARQNAFMVKNNIESSYELLKVLIGFDDVKQEISVVDSRRLQWIYPSPDESIQQALQKRPDYRAVIKRLEIGGQRVRLASGKRLPSLSLNGEYMERSGNDLDFSENWAVALRLSVPVFDGGSIRAGIISERKELEKIREEKRMLKLGIIRDVKDAYIHIENARERIDVSMAAVKTAKEVLRIELLKFETGAGTSTDVIDAQTALLRTETDYYQAVFDNNIALVSLKKAIGDEGDLIKEVVE